MTEPEPKPRRRHRYILVALLTIVIIPVLIAIVANIFFLAGSIPQEKLAPPKKLLTLKPDKSTAPTGMKFQSWESNPDIPAQQKYYLDFCKSRNPSARNLLILDKWQPRMQPLIEEYHKHFNPQVDGKYTQWDDGDPINEDQAKWLRNHAEFIKDMIELSSAGGFPEISCEQAAAFSDENLANMLIPYYFNNHFISKTLAAEARRRQDAGDFSGAGDIVLALSRLAQSADEPSLISLAMSYSSFEKAEFATMCQLLSGSIPIETAKQLHDELDKIPADDFRRQLEIFYRGQRATAVKWLNGPFSELFFMQWHLDTFKSGSYDAGKYYIRYMADHPFNTISQSIDPALATAKMKSKASSTISEIDNRFSQYLEKYKPANFWNPNAKFFQIKSSNNMFVRNDYAGYFPETAKQYKAKRNLELAGLDYVLGISKDGSTTRTDPFTAAPLKVIQKENEIIIYSVGIDRKDQHATEYNETIQLGDISIRVPKRQ
ncbi:hypothetical protein LLG95_16300 [bacterium]|nr:hypothetical protein [bacterium]